MRFDKFIPHDILRPYVKHIAISEADAAHTYKVFPTTGMVIGFQYSGALSTLQNNEPTLLSSAGITGITDSYRTFSNSPGTGTVLVYFTEAGFAHFSSCPANDLFNQSITLADIFDKHRIGETEERLSLATTDAQRIKTIGQFLISQLKDIARDKLVVEAVRLIYNAQGNIRISELANRLFTSQSPLEKRFRKVVGTTPKKFATIVRLNAVLDNIDATLSLTDLCYEHHFFDQAHFTRAFKQFTGDTPEQYRRLQ